MASAAFIIGSIYANRNNSDEKEIAEADVMPGYTQIDAVQGVSFFVNSRFVDKATAITQVSDSVSFQKNQYYSYKNGIDKYLLFNMEEIIVAVEKGTDFWISEATDKPFALQNASLLNIWFTQGSKKFDSQTEDGITTTIANAGVSINDKTYGDFCGKLVNINKDGEEWSIYVGVPGERYDKLSDASQDGIESIVNTFKFENNAVLLSQDTYAVSLDGDANKQVVASAEKEVNDENSLNLTNQSAVTDKEDDMAYSSTPYSMLELEDKGILSAFNDFTTEYEEPIVCPTQIYRGEEAQNIIRTFCEETGQYTYFNAPEGSQWEVVEYNLNYRNCKNDDYVNVQIKGLDGEILKYRGIKYIPRTYDITNKIEENEDWINHFFAYFAVPNGCYEYCLEFGEEKSVNEQEVNAAYYHIINTDFVPDDNVVINPDALQKKEPEESDSKKTTNDSDSQNEAENQSEDPDDKEETSASASENAEPKAKDSNEGLEENKMDEKDTDISKEKSAQNTNKEISVEDNRDK